MRKAHLPWLAVAAALALFAVLYTRSLPVQAGLAASRQPQPAASDTSPGPLPGDDGGPTAIRLDPSTQARLGIQTSRLDAVREQSQMTLPAVVLPVQALIGLIAAYQTAAAQLEKAQITARVSEREHARLEKLYNNQGNASAKAMESAAGIYHGDEVDVHMARENLALAAASVRQNWGDVVAGWVTRGSNTLHRVLRRQDVLLEMTLPPGEPFQAPAAVEFDLPAGGRASAELISAIPQVDPRVQGVGFLYVTRARPGLAPGFNLVAHFGVGALATGVVVPSSAVVWWRGKAWAYVMTPAGTFARRVVPTGVPEPGGWFVTSGFAPGDRVVTRDAEQLLAIESTPPTGSAAGGKGD
jgi:multidrug efflux system membrane fusion protein